MDKEKKSVSFIYKSKEGNVYNPVDYEMIRDKWSIWLKYAEPLLVEEYFEV